MKFDIVDIRPSPYSYRAGYFHIAPVAGTRFVARQATMLDLVTMAYGVERDAVSGGPPGLEFDHYDIVGKVPAGTTQADGKYLFQSLLEDRFKLVAKPEMKPLPATLLKVGKGPVKMKPAADTTASGRCLFHAPAAAGTPSAPPTTITLTCTNLTMQRLADQVRGVGGFAHPVLDATELKGGFDFEFTFSWGSAGGPGFVPLTEALDKLGLKVEEGTAPRQAMTIVSMAETPTPNAPDIDKLLPQPPLPSFEVATIRPTEKLLQDMQTRGNGGNQMNFTGGRLIELIAFSWGTSTTTIFDAPAFAEKEGWDVTAKLPTPEGAPKTGPQPWLDYDEVRLMMRSLLVERFGLKAHKEDRPGNAYTLLAATPKLKKADPANRSSCSGRVAPGEKDPRAGNPMLTSYLHCQNVTLDQFAQSLQDSARDMIKSSLLNATGIEGRYDITVAYSDSRTLSPPANTGGGGQGAGAAGAASSDPVGTPVSLQDALQKQLGLKLVLQKRPIAALVVDHVEEKPTDN